MDRVTKTVFEEFVREQGLALPEDEAFERFANFACLSSFFSDTFDVEDLDTGAGDDTGIDGIAVIVNGVLVTEPEQIEKLRDTNKYVEAAFVFIQAKTGSNLDGAELTSFSDGVRDFFADHPRFRRNTQIREFVKLQEAVFSESAHFTRGRPVAHLRYVYTGQLRADQNIEGRLAAAIEELDRTNLFSAVTFKIVDAQELQDLYSRSKAKVRAEVVIEKKIVLPTIAGVDVSYLAILPAVDYVRIISDSSGSGINHSLFEDNVRDFQDYNAVNREIQATLQSDAPDRFVILNNGVTLVARALQTVGDRFFLEDYQIVNGCQSSYVLFGERDKLLASTHVPIKIIATDDDDVIASIVQATNRQNPIKIEDLSALSAFQRKLERYFATFDDRQRLFYERRPKQYASTPGIEKVRIITRPIQIRAFSSMFLNDPHRAVRYYGELVEGIGTRIFADDHVMLSYYTSAYAYYKMEFLFRNGALGGKYRPGRYQMLMALRCAVAGYPIPPLGQQKKTDRYCEKLLKLLWDDAQAARAFAKAGDVVIACAERLNSDPANRDTYKTQALTDEVLKQYAPANLGGVQAPGRRGQRTSS